MGENVLMLIVTIVLLLILAIFIWLNPVLTLILYHSGKIASMRGRLTLFLIFCILVSILFVAISIKGGK